MKECDILGQSKHIYIFSGGQEPQPQDLPLWSYTSSRPWKILCQLGEGSLPIDRLDESGHFVPHPDPPLVAALMNFQHRIRVLWRQLPRSDRVGSRQSRHNGVFPVCRRFFIVKCPLPLSPSITHSLFHSRLKTHLFHKSFPP